MEEDGGGTMKHQKPLEILVVFIAVVFWGVKHVTRVLWMGRGGKMFSVQMLSIIRMDSPGGIGSQRRFIRRNGDL